MVKCKSIFSQKLNDFEQESELTLDRYIKVFN